MPVFAPKLANGPLAVRARVIAHHRNLVVLRAAQDEASPSSSPPNPRRQNPDDQRRQSASSASSRAEGAPPRRPSNNGPRRSSPPAGNANGERRQQNGPRPPRNPSAGGPKMSTVTGQAVYQNARSRPTAPPTDTWDQIRADAAAAGTPVDLERTVELVRALVKLQRTSIDRKMVLEMCSAVVEHPEADAKALVGACWCLAESKVIDARLIDKIYSLLRVRVAEINEGGISTLLYASGIMNKPIPGSVLEVCLKHLEERGISPRAPAVTITSILFGLSRGGDQKAFRRAEAAIRPALVRMLFKGMVQLHLTLSVFRSYAMAHVPVDESVLDGLFFSLRTYTPAEGLNPAAISNILSALNAGGAKGRFTEFLDAQRAAILRDLAAGRVGSRLAADILASVATQVGETDAVDVALARALIDAALKRPEDLHGRVAPYFLWAIAKLDLADEFETAETALLPLIRRQLSEGDIMVHNVGALLYGYGRMRLYLDTELCNELVTYIEENGSEFTHLSGSSVLWGFARLGAVEVYTRAEEALRQRLVESVLSGEMTNKALDNAMWSYAEVGMAPPPELTQAFDRSFAQGEASDSVSLEQMLRAVTWYYIKAVLTQVPTNDQLRTLSALLKKHGKTLTPSKLCLLSWSLGVLLCSGPGISLQADFWDCWRAVIGSLPTEAPQGPVRVASTAQLFHSYLMMQAAAPKGRQVGSVDGVSFPEWALAMGRDQWMANQAASIEEPDEGAPPEGRNRSRVNIVQEGVFEALVALGMEPRPNVLSEDRMVKIDVALKEPGQPKVAICIDGPLQFCKLTGRKLGMAYCRDRLLEARGWEVLSIPSSDWEAARLPMKQAKYLRSRLAAANVVLPPSAMGSMDGWATSV